MLKFFKNGHFAEAEAMYSKALEFEQAGNLQEALNKVNQALQKLPEHQLLLVKRFALEEKIAGKSNPLDQFRGIPR